MSGRARTRPLALTALACACAAPRGDREPADVPPGFELAATATFEDASSLARWTFSDPAAWRWSDDGALELTGPSDYTPPHRSPHSIALLDEPAAGDLVLEADLLQTGREYGHRDLCIFVGYVDAAHYTYVHLATAPDAHAHNVFLVDGAPRRALAPVAAAGIDWGTNAWHRVRVERVGGRVRVFFDDLQTPVLEADGATLGVGHVGFGSFDDQGRIDNVRLWAREVEARAAPRFEAP